VEVTQHDAPVEPTKPRERPPSASILVLILSILFILSACAPTPPSLFPSIDGFIFAQHSRHTSPDTRDRRGEIESSVVFWPHEVFLHRKFEQPQDG